MSSATRSKEIFKSLVSIWKTFSTVAGEDQAKYLAFSLLFVKYVSDVWRDQYAQCHSQFGDSADMIAELSRVSRFSMPRAADFQRLLDSRFEPGNAQRIDAALSAIEDGNREAFNLGSEGLFGAISFGSICLGANERLDDILIQVLEQFANPSLDLRPSHLNDQRIVPDACQAFLLHTAAQGKQKAADAYSPACLSALMAALIEPKAGESFGDMACGSGLSLIALAEACEDSSPACKVYGQDINPIEASLAQMNLVMHGIDGHQIACGDSIRNPRFVVGGQQLQQFDVQVSHPPFAVDEWGYEEASNDPFGRYTYGIPPKNRSDYSFILHMVAMMKVGSGRMAVIVQKGVLTRGGAEAEIRRALLKDNLLDAVIDLPEKSCFGTVIQVSVMILRRDRVRRDVLFVDASKSFVAGKINTLSEADIEKIVGVYKDPHVSEGFSFLASVEDIEANDCSFAPHHYIKAESSKKVVSIDVLLARQKDLTVDLLSLQAEMDQIVAEAGIQ